MSDMVKVAEEIEEKLNSVGLVGSRIGSGFNFVNDSRDVQFNYTPGIIEGIKAITENYHGDIEKIVNEVISKYDDLEVRFAYRLNNFSFYISPKIDEIKCEEEACGETDNTTSDSIDNLVLPSNSDEMDKQRTQLTEAKEIIRDLLQVLPKENIEGIYEINEKAEQFLKDSNIDEAIWQTNEELDFDKIADEVKLTAKQYAMVSDCIERVSANEREFDKDSEEILKEVAEKFKADYKELNKEKAE